MGFDGISIKMINLCLSNCLEALTNIINNSISSQVVPALWKKSTVTPIPKKNPPSSLSDLRFIHVLPTASKILERIIYNQVQSYADKHIFPSSQSGYRQLMGTNTALLKISDEISCNMDASKATFLILLDYSKAFDTIQHDLIVAKLRYFGFSADAVNWFASYLSGRTQNVKWYGSISNELPTSRGVPQGSILGPVCFSIHVADLPDSILRVPGCGVIQYVDDTQVYCSIMPSNVPEAVQTINSALESLHIWSESNGLMLNPTKSVALCCGSSSVRDKVVKNIPNIMLNNIQVSIELNVKNLGVIFDSFLNFELHISKILECAYAKLKYIYQYRYDLSPDLKWKLCTTLVLSHFNYCSSTYYKYLNEDFKNRIQKIQNSCFRYSFSVPYTDHITPYYNEKKILKMSFVFLVQYLCLLYKILQSGQPIYLYNLLCKRCDIYDNHLRNKHLYHIPKHNTSKFENAFSYLAVKLLNKYHFLNEAPSVMSLRHSLKKYFLDKQNNYEFDWY